MEQVQIDTTTASAQRPDGPRLYVGTYGKYAAGSIKGAWLDLDDYASADDFLEACRELHKDEADPELMFQDFEGFPREFYAESYLHDNLWDWIEADDSDREMWAAWLDATGEDTADLRDIRDAFAGTYDSARDWAAEFIDSCGYLQNVPDVLVQYFDYDAYARDAQMGGDLIFHRFDGALWVFWNH